MWTVDFNKQHALKIFSDNSQSGYGEISIPAPTDQSLFVNSFSDANLTLYNTQKINDNFGGEDIKLKLDDRIVNLVFDRSGSMSWNDKDELDLEIAKRLIRRISATYPGLVEYNVLTYGGKKVSISVGAALLENNPLSHTFNTDSIYLVDDFVDRDDDFYGIRVLRKEGSFSDSPIDGELVYDGVAKKVYDNELVVNTTYYYSIYTFDSNYHFSDPVQVIVSPQSGDAPTGIKTFSGETLNGSSVRVDSNVEGAWHLDEGTENTLYDMNATDDLTLSDVNPVWLTENETPVGRSGLRFDGIHTTASTAIANRNFELLENQTMTLMFWIKPYDNSITATVIARSGVAVRDYAVIVASGSVFLSTPTLVASDAGVITENEWNHVAITMDYSDSANVNVEFFVNGISSGTSSIGKIYTPADMFLDIGFDRLGVVDQFAGEMTEVSVHKSIRSSTYILEQFNNSVTDNGDRLAILKYSVPATSDSIGGTARIVKNDFSIPGNEDDGSIIYEAVISAGNFYTTYREDFILNNSYNFRMFANNSSDFYNNINDSINVPLLMEDIDSKNRQSLPVSVDDIPGPSNVVLREGNEKNYISWTLSNLNGLAERILVYMSNESFPITEDDNFAGTKVFDGNADETNFVHRRLQNGDSYYYSVFTIDRYNRISNVANVAGTPERDLNDDGIPLRKIENLSYEILNGTSANISWNTIPNPRRITGYFDDDIIVYSKLLDEFDNLLAEDLQVDSTITVESTIADDAAEDVFNDETSITVPSDDELYNFVLTNIEDGVNNGVLTVRFSSGSVLELLKNIKRLKFTIQMKIFVPDVNSEIDSNGDYVTNVFEYHPQEVEVILDNPLDFDITNRDKKTVEIKCNNAISVLDDNSPLSIKTYDGTYINASENFVSRLIMSYKNNYNRNFSNIQIALYNTDKDLCDSSEAEKSALNDSLLVATENKSTQIDLLDELGNASGSIDANVFDVSIDPPSVPQNILMYAKVSMFGVSLVKKFLVVFDSTLKIELLSNAPIANGVNVAEQMANVFVIDPDDPDNVSKREYPDDNTIVKWELIKQSNSYPQRIIYSDDDIAMPDGVYSYITNGISDNVFVGPVSGVEFQGYDNDGNILYESHLLQASVLYDGMSVTSSRVMNMVPVGFDGQESAGSHLLMEFDNVKQTLYTDGRFYVKALISHDASTSATAYSSCFRSCMTSLGKTIYELLPGQVVNITSDEEELEIIWGDVIEQVDPYTGELILDISSANIDYGSAFVSLDDGDSTEVYFRLGKDIAGQRSTGFEEPSNECFCAESKIVKYENEITVSASITSVFDGKGINITGGGNVSNAIVPTVIIPQEPLEIRIWEKTVDNNRVDNIVIDGVSENNILFDVSSAGYPILNGTEVQVSVTNIYNDAIKVQDATLNVDNDVDDAIDEGVVRSYATIVLDPIPQSTTFDALITLTVDYALSNDTKTFCIRLTNDAEDSVGTSTFFSAKNSKHVIGGVTWTDVADMTTGRGYFSIEAVADKIYAMGGINGNVVLKSTEVYNPVTDAWLSLENMNTARFGTSSVVVGTDIYVFGGIEYNSNDNALVVSRKVEKYDTVADTWTELEDMPQIGSGVSSDGYGNAYGSAEYISSTGNVYILSGIRKIASDGLSFVYNDRILSYNISGDSWSYTDAIDAIDTSIYYRLCPCSFIKGNIIYALNGTFEENNQLDYLSSAYKYNVVSGLLTEANNLFDDIPELKYKSAYTSFNNIMYVVGGSNDKSGNLKTFESVDFSAAEAARAFTYTGLVDLEQGRNGSGAAVVNDGANDGLYVIGGIESGKGKSFLSVVASIASDDMILDGKNNIEVEIDLTDDNGDSPSGDILVGVKGYLQFADATGVSVPLIQRNISQNVVLFVNDTITTVDGKGFAQLYPRADDIITTVIDNIAFHELEDDIRYKIVIEATVMDDLYYGKNFVNVVEEFEQIDIDTSSCVNINSNMLIEGLGILADDTEFQIISDFLYQEPASSIDCIGNELWLTSIEDLTDTGLVSASSAIDIIDNEVATKSFLGASPLYDALIFGSKILSDTLYDSIGKTNFVFADHEPNGSVETLADAIMYVNGIDEAVSPVVIANMSVHDIAIDSILEEETRHSELNLISNGTGGQAFTIAVDDFEDRDVGNMAGHVKGGLGYGSAEYVLDLSEIVNLNSVIVSFELPANTNGQWRIAVSEDGYNYSNFTDKFEPEYEALFGDILARYIKFDMELTSGISISDAEGYEDVPSPNVPKIISMTIDYTGVKEDFIFLNKETIDRTVQQIVISTGSNIDSFDTSDLNVGASTAHSHNWNDYNRDSKPDRDKGGKIIIPIRNGEILDTKIEPLIRVDDFMYKTSNSGWDEDSTVVVRDSSDVAISSSEYVLRPRDGVVIFAESKRDDLRIEITNPTTYNVGIKTSNYNSGQDITVNNVGFMYNKNNT
jgi:hypothetical protein